MTVDLAQASASYDPSSILSLVGLGLLAAAFLGYVLLFVAALISILGSPHTGGMKFAWLVFAFVAPFLGSLMWFLAGRGDSYRRRCA